MRYTVQMQLDLLHYSKRYFLVVAIVLVVVLLVFASRASESQILENRKSLDRTALAQVLPSASYDNDLLDDVVRLPGNTNEGGWVRLELLGLKHDRLAYLAKSNGEVTMVIVPATAEDGFNGEVDLLVAIDMFGRIQAASVLDDMQGSGLYGMLRVIESQWMKLFKGNTFRDIQRLSWQTIPADNEYDLFVGASVTPKTVSAKIYDVLVFFQSNRIAFIEGAASDI